MSGDATVFGSGPGEKGAASVLTDAEVLAAVRRELLNRRESTDALDDPGDTTRCLLVEGSIVRLVETRRETRQVHYGSIDLARRPVYGADLQDYAVPVPEDLSTPTTLKLVRRGSVSEHSCDCGNGRVGCKRCEGTGDLHCEPWRPCGDCRGLDCCLRCDGTGKQNRRPQVRSEPGGEATERVTCKQCGSPASACATCRGRGKVRCTRCDGTGARECTDCHRAGTVVHDHCKGKARIVTWTEGIIARRPDVAPIKITPALPCPARQQAQEHGDWTRTQVTGKRATVGKDSVIADVLEPYLGIRKGEITRRISVRHLSVVRLTLTAHPHRVYYVIPTHGAPRVLVLPSKRRTWQGVALLVAGLAVLALAARFFA
ncbi:hypothetical protein ACF059_30490 [Streptomyces sp. NPDC016562]|uniref:hypothetical protein n=1 Tax=Streptomyces sp. NPDC016562 TaxID=3364966 RepID=UPI0036FB49C4